MKDRFEKIFQHTLKWEGADKLHLVKGDSGGWTKYGIAYNYNKKHFKSLDDFKAMDYSKAAEIAFNNYCSMLHLELVPQDCQAMLFDMAFNMGVKRAIVLLQRALNVKDDGILGSKTKEALEGLKKADLYEQRVKYYNAIVKNNQTQKKFLKGWLNRAFYFLENKI